jgi:hypothetical protein
MDDKVIVTHRMALARKYGTTGLARIRAGLTALVAADRTRGIRTRVVFLDDAGTMKRLRSQPVESASDPRRAKIAIDAVFEKLEPAYLMILGAPDVIPHQDLSNPAYSAGDDDDRFAFGDLPYACPTAYAHDPARFVGPTRVVSRLPDLTGATEPSHLLALLRTAATWKSRRRATYARCFALSADEWKGSTRKSLDTVFGSEAALVLAPPRGPRHGPKRLRAPAHFINCHGGESAPEFYGQKGARYPLSLSTKTVARGIRKGTVASVECCYGAQLYDSISLEQDVPICQSYLRQGAYAWLGATTIAYGPAEDNGAADLICQYFLASLLEGASVGRAALEARQRFVEVCAQMDPMDLKTLAQFCVYGDPSVQPVDTPEGAGVRSDDAERFRRRERRAKLAQTGDFLQETKPTASKREKRVRAKARARAALANIAAKGGLPRTQRFAAFKVAKVKRTRGEAAKVATAPSHYYLAVGRPKAARRSRFKVAVVAKEVNGRIVDYRIYQQR